MNRRVLITGTTRGLGRFLAEHALLEGEIVVGCGPLGPDDSARQYVHQSSTWPSEAAVNRGVRRTYDGASAARRARSTTPARVDERLRADAAPRRAGSSARTSSAAACSPAAIRLLRRSTARADCEPHHHRRAAAAGRARPFTRPRRARSKCSRASSHASWGRWESPATRWDRPSCERG